MTGLWGENVPQIPDSVIQGILPLVLAVLLFPLVCILLIWFPLPSLSMDSRTTASIAGCSCYFERGMAQTTKFARMRHDRQRC